MIEVILLEPETAGNVGAVARVMKNFGFKNLRIIRPQCEIQSKEAKKRAKHANDVLNKSTISDGLNPDDYNILIGTTGKRANPRNVKRSYIDPEEIRNKVSEDEKYGILFGRESIGLKNEEIKKCDLIASIPTNEDYPVMNLSHSISIILYALSKGEFPKEEKASKEVINTINNKLKRINDQLEFRNESRREKMGTVLKKIVSKSSPTEKQASMLCGFLSKIEDELKED